MSKGKSKSRRRMGHPAKVAERQGDQVVKRPVPAPKARPAAKTPPRHRTAPGGGARRSPGLETKMAELWRSILRLGAPRLQSGPGPRALSPLTLLSSADFLWAAGSGLAAALLFATTLSGHVALGDGPETVAGISSVGVLHAPGYPAYVAAAKLFTILVPFGTEALRVNLFSLFCASLSVAGVQLLARRCGAPRWAAAAAALCLASGTGFWFYATFAKHDMFSALMFLAALHLTLAWLQRSDPVRLVWLAVALAAGAGSSWPLMVLLLPAVGFVLIVSRARLSLRALASATATGMVVLVALYGFAMVRASAHPAVDWGGATNLSRLVGLVKRSDFGSPGVLPAASPASPGQASGSPGAGSSAPAAAPQGPAAPPASPNPGALPGAGTVTTAAIQGVTGSIGSYFVVFARELGIFGLLLAGLGLGISLLRRRTVATFPLMIVFGVNLLGAAALVGPGGGASPEIDLIEEGFLFGCYFALTCWLAIGAGELVKAVARIPIVARAGSTTHPGAVIGVVAALLAGLLIVPPALGNRSGASRSAKPFADRYASSVFSELPPHSAVVIWGAELTQPLIYRQVIDHQRRDVLVVAADGLSYDWYRQELRQKLHQALPARLGESVRDARAVTKRLSGLRSVYVDNYTAQLLVGPRAVGKNVGGATFGYQPVGLLARVVPGNGLSPVASPAVLDQVVSRAVRQAGFPDPRWLVWPNNYLDINTYSAAELEVARAYFQHRDLNGMRRALSTDLSIDPASTIARNDLQALAQSRGSG